MQLFTKVVTHRARSSQELKSVIEWPHINNISPNLFMLSKEDQLRVGNQLVALMRARLKSWDKVNKLVEGQLKLSDLVGSERIEPSEIELIRKDSIPSIL